MTAIAGPPGPNSIAGPTPFDPSLFGYRPIVAFCIGDSILGGGWSSSTVTITGNGTTATVTWVGHPVFPGAVFAITEAVEDQFNGMFTCASVSGNTFTYTASAPLPASATGTITCVMNHRVTTRNFFAIANAALGWPVDRIYSSATSGSTTARALSTFNSVRPPETPNLIVIQTGTNDVRADVPLATTKANISNLVAAALGLGARVILCTVPPGSDATWTSARVQVAMNLNDWIRRLVMRDPRMVLCDTYSAAVDPTSSTNAYRANYGSSDNIHPSDYGCQRIASEAMQVALRNLIPGAALANPWGRFVHNTQESYAINSGNLQIVTNPLMQGTAGALAGGATGANVPNNWTVTKTGAGATLAVTKDSPRSDGYGDNLIMTITPSASNDAGELTGANVSAAVVGGDIIQLEVQIAGTSLAALEYIEASIDFTFSGASYMCRAIHRSGQTPGWPDDFDYVFRSLPFTVPGTLTNLQPRIKANFTGPAAANTIKVARAAIRKLT